MVSTCTYGIRNPDVKSYKLVYLRFRSGRGGGVGSKSENLGDRVFRISPPKFYWATPTEFQIYHRKPQLKPSRLAPFLSNLG